MIEIYKLLVFALVLLAATPSLVFAKVGDVNGDGKVDITDVAMVSGAFGAVTGDPRYLPNADLNSDGRIDIVDVAIVCANFGN